MRYGCSWRARARVFDELCPRAPAVRHKLRCESTLASRLGCGAFIPGRGPHPRATGSGVGRRLGSVDLPTPSTAVPSFVPGGAGQPTAAHFFTDGPRPAESGENFHSTEIFRGRVRERAVSTVFMHFFAGVDACAGQYMGAYRSRATFEAVRGRGMTSALEPAGAVELSMRYWRFISGRRCAVDRLEARCSPTSSFVSSCFGTAVDVMRRGSGRLVVLRNLISPVGLGRVDGENSGGEETSPSQRAGPGPTVAWFYQTPNGVYTTPPASYSPLLHDPQSAEKWPTEVMGPLGAAEAPGRVS